MITEEKIAELRRALALLQGPWSIKVAEELLDEVECLHRENAQLRGRVVGLEYEVERLRSKVSGQRLRQPKRYRTG